MTASRGVALEKEAIQEDGDGLILFGLLRTQTRLFSLSRQIKSF